MLACKLDVEVHFDIGLTIISAVVAVIFTFAALASPYASEAIENSAPVKTFSHWNHLVCTSVASLCTGRRAGDIEAGYTPLPSVNPDVALSTTEDNPPNEGEDPESDTSSDVEGGDEEAAPAGRPHRSRAQGEPSFPYPQRRRASSATLLGSVKPKLSPPRTARPRPIPADRQSVESTPSSSSTTTSSSDSSTQEVSTLTSSSSNSWNEPLRHGLSREARLRIRARAKERPVPHFGARYWLRVHYQSVTLFLFFRAVVWAAAIVFMHYCGAHVTVPDPFAAPR